MRVRAAERPVEKTREHEYFHCLYYKMNPLINYKAMSQNRSRGNHHCQPNNYFFERERSVKSPLKSQLALFHSSDILEQISAK